MALAAGTGRAADQTILGNTIQVKDAGTATGRKVVVKAKEIGSPNTIVGNPKIGGATLEIRLDGGTPSSQTFGLPPGTSLLTNKPYWTGDAVTGFKYKDPKGENGAVRLLQIKRSSSGLF